MKVFAIASILLTVASAQLMDLPTCAIECTEKPLKDTGCNLTDYKCICSSASFLKDVAACVTTTCPPAELQKVATFSQELCANSGASLPSEALAAASSAIGSPGPAASSAASSAASAASSAASSAAAAKPTDNAGEMNRPAVMLAGLAAVLGAIAV